MRPQKRILMCINEPDLTKVVTLMIQTEFGHAYELSIKEIRYIDLFLAEAQRQTADLYILLLNNMFYSDVRLCGDSQGVDPRLAVIAELRQSYQKPVIALTGFPDRYTEENTLDAGATCYFVLPVEGELFRNAVKQCLGAATVARQG